METYSVKEKIINPHFIDDEKTKIRFKILFENGKECVAELTVPENREKGKNKYWDRIVENFDIAELENDLDRRLENQAKKIQHLEEKKKSQQKTLELKTLFNMKTRIFEHPLTKSLDTETKSAIRRAPTMEILMFFLYDIYKDYLTTHKMSYNDFLDYLDDLEDE